MGVHLILGQSSFNFFIPACIIVKKYNPTNINIVEAAEGRIVKVIIESCLWTEEEIKIACEVVQGSSAQFVKSSTGFSTHGATVDHIKIMRESVGDLFGVKASGGIKSFDDALMMIQAGANRLGTSSGAEIMKTEKLKS